MQWAEGRVGTSTGLREHPTLLHQVSPETCRGWTGQQEPIAGRFSRSHREDPATPYCIVSYRIVSYWSVGSSSLYTLGTAGAKKHGY